MATTLLWPSRDRCGVFGPDARIDAIECEHAGRQVALGLARRGQRGAAAVVVASNRSAPGWTATVPRWPPYPVYVFDA
jgi:hypothetical protein